jgi:hypothetical protein
MNLLIKQYLSSLRERGELDVILPDVLSERGFRVFSRPSIGTRQHGVDVAAVGEDIDGVRKVFLFSVKAGDLTRPDWDSNEQSLRPSLNEIQDVYVPNRIPSQYKDLPVVICITLGGDILEAVSENVRTYVSGCSTDHVSFQEWDGDHLAQFIHNGILQENSLPENFRSMFRKSVAMVDEPDVAYKHYRHLVGKLIEECADTRKARLTVLRQIALTLWILFVWSRDANNLETPIRCGEYAVLRAWKLIATDLAGTGSAVETIQESFSKLVTVQRSIVDSFLKEKIFPVTSVLHGLTTAVPSSNSLDRNLRMSSLLGRVAQHGLWLVSDLEETPVESGKASDIENQIKQTANYIVSMVNNNPILLSPIMDEAAIELNATFIFLRAAERFDAIADLIRGIFGATSFSYQANGKYPCVYTNYRDLIAHPKCTDEYREDATSGSILLPTLVFWAALLNDAELLTEMKKFVEKYYSHSTLQLWFPGEDTELHLYDNSEVHGLCLTDIAILEDCEKNISAIQRESEATEHFDNLSAVQFGYWPIITLASLHHRLPIAPQLWFR